MSNDPNQQGQYPPHSWSTGHPEYVHSQYPPQSGSPAYRYPPPSSSDMAAMPQMQHPQPGQYHLPPPQGAYQQRPPELYAPAPTQAPPPPHVVYQAAAPRQRTAIACRYCRRRKIRCSGFDTSHDGRCSNCIRFNQECMFTPVSSQAQAFVPAHAAYPHLRNGQGQARGGGRGNYPAEGLVLYGAHGQPLPASQPPQHSSEATLPPPQAGYQQPYSRAPPPPLVHTPAHNDQVSRKRPRPDDIAHPSHPTHAPSSSAASSHSSHSSQQRPLSGRPASGADYDYPEPSNLAPISPAVTSSGYQPHSAAYYPPPQDRRPSPQSAPQYDNRPSASPHGSASSTSALSYPPLQTSQLTPTRDSGVTPPPGNASVGSTGSGRSGLSVRDMLGPTEGKNGRSSTDSDMLNALNRRGLNQ